MMRTSVFLTVAAIAVQSTGARAQTISAQSASISAAGSTIAAVRVPVQTGNSTAYYDVTISLSATGNGVSASATSAPSQIIQTIGFVAGTYRDAAGQNYTENGPGVGPGGSTAWTLAADKRGACEILGATWYTDNGVNNPEHARLVKAKITTTAYSFGVSGGNCSGGADGHVFYNGALVGAQQSGNSLAISSYSRDSKDYPTPQETLVFTLQ